MKTIQQAEKWTGTIPKSKEVVYPATCKTAATKEKHKDKILKENPEVLFTDYAQQRQGRKKNNFLFFTDSIYAWKDALCSHYAHVSSEGIGSGGRLKFCKDEHLDKDDPLLTITYYTKGKVMIQGNEDSLESFEEVFPLLKAEVNNKKAAYVHSDNEANGSPADDAHSFCISAPPSPTSLTNLLKEGMALLEMDYAEFKEQTQARLADLSDNLIQELKVELQQLKKDNHKLASDLGGNVQLFQQLEQENKALVSNLHESLEALKKENGVLRAQLAKVKEDAEKREQEFTGKVHRMIEELLKGPSMTSTETQMMPISASDPCPVSEPPSQLRSQQHNILEPSTESDANSQVSPSQLPSAQSHPQVVLLADSNGKFLDTEKLFPGKRVLSKRCSTTGQAMKLLKREILKSPECLVIHTGTNDLHRLQKDTAGAMMRMAEQASMEFPDSRIVVSTLLPRRDTPPHVIYEINMEVRKGCTNLPNVHLAQHPTIGTWDLYDGLHLHKERVKIFLQSPLKTQP